MLKIFYKVIRKISNSLTKLLRKHKIFQYKLLYENRFFFKSGLNIGKNFLAHFDISSSKIIIESDVIFRNYCEIRAGLNGVLTIGKNTFFNNSCSINCFLEINIGENCQFGEAVKIYDHNHKHSNNKKLINEQGYTFGAISIGNNCWIGSDVVILKGVIIGENVIIGTGCIIYKSIPSNSIIVNNQNLISL